jgi:hypothetical protein
VFALFFFIYRVWIDRLLVILFIDSNTTPPAIRGGSFFISNLYSCMTAYGASSGTFVFFNLTELVIHLYPQDKAR